MIELKLPTQQPKPAEQPATKPELQESFATLKQPRPDFVSYLLVMAVGLLLGFTAAGVLHDEKREKRDDQGQIEPDGSDSEKQTNIKRIEAKGAFFVFIYEFQTKTVEQELLLRDLSAWSQIYKCEYRTFDQDSKEAEVYKAAAEKAGLESPFLAVVRDKKIVRVVEWPRDRQALERLVK